MEPSFNDKSKCDEIAKVGDWLMDSLPEVTKRPEDFWDTKNLWRCCVCVDGKYTIGRYRAMVLLDDHGLGDPASDFARPIVEAAFRLDYLSDDEKRLTDYARWQLLDIYHRVLGSIEQFEGIGPEAKKKCADEMAEIKAILSDNFTHKPPRATWKPLDQLITFKNATQNQDRLRKQLYTVTGITLSRGLHNAWLSPASAHYGFDAGRLGFVMAMDLIGKICLDKELVGSQGTYHAKRIVKLCAVDSWEV